MNALFLSQFAYCPLARILHSRELNHKINRLHERSLRVAYHGKTYYKKIILSQCTIEISKSWSQKCSESTRAYFQTSLFSTRTVESIYYGTESLGFLGPKIWELVPAQVKNVDYLETFKSSIKKGEPKECP